MKQILLILSCLVVHVIAIAQSNTDKDSSIIFTKVDIDAEFPGGNAAWNNYMSKSLKKYEKAIRKEGLTGTAVFLFIIEKDGSVSNVRLLSCKDAGVPNCLPQYSQLAIAGAEIIINSPKWNPASQNGRPVRAYRRQPLSAQ